MAVIKWFFYDMEWIVGINLLIKVVKTQTILAEQSSQYR